VPVRIIGAPGSGKTMLATLAEFRMVEKILKDVTNQTNRTLAAAFGQGASGATAGHMSLPLGCRWNPNTATFGNCRTTLP
jgi:hypothetical protein